MSLSLNRKLVSQEDAALIQRPDVPRSRFTGSWTRKTTFDGGYLVPIMVEEILPGDMIKWDVTAYVRMATPIFPIMDNLRIVTFFFFVPNRLVWANWERFCGEQVNPADSIAYTIPAASFAQSGTQNAVATLADYLGLPVGNLAASQSIPVNILPFRAYNLIYNEWFRDQNLINSAPVEMGDTVVAAFDTTNYALRYRAKAHDYFTTCLPWPQKFTAPTVVIGGSAPVKGIGTSGAATAGSQSVSTSPSGTSDTYTSFWNANAGNVFVRSASGYPDVFADLSQATGISINDFRQAMSIQSLLERDARGGTRYTEIVKNHFGVTSADSRLQRPEFLGGGSTPLMLTPVAQTATGGSGIGTLGAAATATGSHRASISATEHGYVLGLINVRSELSYQQGLHKMWTRSTRYDFYWPSLAGLGEQAVLRQELYCTGTDANDTAVFGYQERWHEYRTRTSEVTGMFRSTLGTNIDEWHLAQQFTSAPVLGQTFIEDQLASATGPLRRALAGGAATANNQFLADILFRREMTRAVPMYGTPFALGRF